MALVYLEGTIACQQGSIMCPFPARVLTVVQQSSIAQVQETIDISEDAGAAVA